MITTIIFDLNQVIVNYFSSRSDKEFERLIGVGAEKFWKESSKYYKRLDCGKLSRKRYLENVLIDLNCPLDLMDNLHELVIRDLGLVEGTIEIVRKLRKNYRVILLAGDSREFFNIKVDKFDLKNEFDALYASFQFNRTKNNPEIFKQVMKKESIRPGECLFIDDLKNYLNAARKAGIKNTIQFSSSKQLRKDIKDMGIKI